MLIEAFMLAIGLGVGGKVGLALVIGAVVVHIAGRITARKFIAKAIREQNK